MSQSRRGTAHELQHGYNSAPVCTQKLDRPGDVLAPCLSGVNARFVVGGRYALSLVKLTQTGPDAYDEAVSNYSSLGDATRSVSNESETTRSDLSFGSGLSGGSTVRGGLSWADELSAAALHPSHPRFQGQNSNSSRADRMQLERHAAYGGFRSVTAEHHATAQLTNPRVVGWTRAHVNERKMLSRRNSFNVESDSSPAAQLQQHFSSAALGRMNADFFQSGGSCSSSSARTSPRGFKDGGATFFDPRRGVASSSSAMTQHLPVKVVQQQGGDSHSFVSATSTSTSSSSQESSRNHSREDIGSGNLPLGVDLGHQAQGFLGGTMHYDDRMPGGVNNTGTAGRTTTSVAGAGEVPELPIGGGRTTGSSSREPGSDGPSPSCSTTTATSTRNRGATPSGGSTASSKFFGRSANVASFDQINGVSLSLHDTDGSDDAHSVFGLSRRKNNRNALPFSFGVGAKGTNTASDAPPDVTYALQVERNLQARLKLATTDICFHPASEGFLVSASSNGILCLWDVTLSGSYSPLLTKWTAGTRALNSICFLPPSGSQMSLISAAADGAVKQWILPDPTQDIGYFESDPDGRERWNRDFFKKLGERPYHSVTEMTHGSRHPVRNLHAQKLSQSTQQLLIAQDDGRVMLYEGLGTKFLLKQSYLVSTQAVYSTRWNPGIPHIFACGTRDKKITVHDTRDRTRPQISIITGAPVGCVRWRPLMNDPHVLASSSSVMDHQILIWDMRATSMPVFVFNTHKKGECASDFFWASGDHIISCGKDSSLQLHSLGNAHQPLKCFSNVKAACGGRNEIVSISARVKRQGNVEVQKRAAHPSMLRAFPEEVVFAPDRYRWKNKWLPNQAPSPTGSVSSALNTLGFGGSGVGSKEKSTVASRILGGAAASIGAAEVAAGALRGGGLPPGGGGTILKSTATVEERRNRFGGSSTSRAALQNQRGYSRLNASLTLEHDPTRFLRIVAERRGDFWNMFSTAPPSSSDRPEHRSAGDVRAQQAQPAAPPAAGTSAARSASAAPQIMITSTAGGTTKSTEVFQGGGVEGGAPLCGELVARSREGYLHALQKWAAFCRATQCQQQQRVFEELLSCARDGGPPREDKATPTPPEDGARGANYAYAEDVGVQVAENDSERTADHPRSSAGDQESQPTTAQPPGGSGDEPQVICSGTVNVELALAPATSQPSKTEKSALSSPDAKLEEAPAVCPLPVCLEGVANFTFGSEVPTAGASPSSSSMPPAPLNQHHANIASHFIQTFTGLEACNEVAMLTILASLVGDFANRMWPRWCDGLVDTLRRTDDAPAAATIFQRAPWGSIRAKRYQNLPIACASCKTPYTPDLSSSAAPPAPTAAAPSGRSSVTLTTAASSGSMSSKLSTQSSGDKTTTGSGSSSSSPGPGKNKLDVDHHQDQPPARQCGKCTARKSMCVVCKQEVRGLFVACPICGFGGCYRHMRDWFANHSSCPNCEFRCLK